MTSNCRAIAIATTITLASPAAANDSEAAIGVGGLVLKQSRSVSMDSEDLFLSAEQVVVKYRFTNRGKVPVKTLVAFPMPALSGDPESESEEGGWHDWTAMKFTTLVAGRPVTLTRIDQALKDGRDVSAHLDAMKLPFRKPGEIMDALQALSAAQKATLSAQGLISRTSEAIVPLWKVQTSFVREQTFPVGRTISVEHRYTPLVGGSVGGGLDAGVRTAKDGSGAYYRETYCTDTNFLTSFDRIRAGRLKANPERMAYSEQWLAYVLKSGANWRGPIKDFRLVVDKGNAASLVSFCMDGVRKISPTRFELRKTNFEPKRDLNILIVNWNLAE